MARVLLIDDNPSFRIMTRRALEGAGHEVRDAENGHIGLRMLSADRADLVVTDILIVPPVNSNPDIVMV
jgi:two-component system chemotaxis response regulator CheY